MKVWMARLGPGLMLAAAAVGVSHLVQSTRAGADFGLSFVWLVILISFLKYPAFRFAVGHVVRRRGGVGISAALSDHFYSIRLVPSDQD